MNVPNSSEMPAIDNFNAHLDECYQCSAFPAELCPEGEILIQATLEEILENAVHVTKARTEWVN